MRIVRRRCARTKTVGAVGEPREGAYGGGPYGYGRGPHRPVRAPSADVLVRQAGTMFSACGPFGPWVTSKLTFWPSRSSRKPWA